MALTGPVALDSPVDSLHGVGPRVAARLARLGIQQVRDLVFHVPSRYQDRTRRVPIGSLRPHAEAVIDGVVELSQVQYGRRRSLVCHVSDGTGAVLLRFFHFSRLQQNRLCKGQHLRCFGEVRPGPGRLEMVHPECQFFDPAAPPAVDTRLTPVYATTEGLHQIRLRTLIEQALAALEPAGCAAAALDELVPARVLASLGLPGLVLALRYVHRPPPDAPVERLVAGIHPAQQRLAFDELLAHHLSLTRLRHKVRARPAPCLARADGLRRRLAAALGFEMTAAQRRAVDEIDADLCTPQPMMRLLQGDVGSGKTAVAAAVATTALAAGYQVALMAPTELLAEQHARTLRAWFEPLDIRVCALTGRQGRREHRAVIEMLATGEPLFVVGTHALFQAGVEYPKLGLVIVDEQHRFGVHQRLALRDKGASGEVMPHQLIMTATPIPRTLAMTAYADLDLSVLDELPPHRQPVRTSVIPERRRAEIIERVVHVCRARRQVYWVCPLIEESDALQAQAATDTAERLGEALPGVRIGLVHGRLPAQLKEDAMRSFLDRETDLLVATTVIEVGVDVPNASLMVIENAERLGLSQLHQLRGRVGRGGTRADCVLLYREPLGDGARQRLQVLRETNDGFRIAERDLALRGPGEVLGTRQTGICEFRIADLTRDARLLPAVSDLAATLHETNPATAEAIVNRWFSNQIEYGNV